MALDPRTLTPAAARSMFLQQTSPANNPAQMGPRMMQPPQMAPQTLPLREAVMQPSSGLEDLIAGKGSVAEEKAAEEVGKEIFGPRLNNADPDKLMTLATDDESKVDASLKPLYDENPDIAKTMGALIKLQNDTSSTQLLQKLVSKEGTPDDAKKEVKEFFDLNKDDEVPVWADVALAIGLDLLDPSNATGSFLGDLAVSGKKGLAVGKARAKEKRGRSDMMNKLAFGVYREDEKQRKTLGLQLAKQIGDQKKESAKLIMEFSKFFQNERKMEETASKNISSSITSTINLLSNDQKAQALPIISQSLIKGAFDDVDAKDVPAHVFGLLKNKGLNLANVADSKSIVESSFTISTKEEFDRYKKLFPTQFGNQEFQDGKFYTIEGFSDKSKVGEAGSGLVSILGIKRSIGDQPTDQLQRFFVQRADLRKAIQGLEGKENTPEYKALVEQESEVDGAITNLTSRKIPMSYVFADGQMVAAGEGAAGAYAASDAIEKANALSKQGNALASAFGLADGLMRSLSSGETPGDNVGVLARLGRYTGGVKGQLTALYNAYGENASDNQSSYTSGAITNAMTGSTQKAVSSSGLGSSKYTVGQVFSNLQKMAKGNTELQSQLMSFAYALAGSRETGKLTDKDVAAALVTFGGGDIAEGKWFANADTLVTGINQALTTATNDYAVRYNKVHQSPGNIKYLKEVEELEDSDIEDRTNFDLNSFLKKNSGIRKNIVDRVIYDPSGANGQIIRMQSLDKYRGDGAGAVDPPPPSNYSQEDLSLFNAIDQLGVIFANDPNGLKNAIDKVDADKLELYKKYKSEQ
jgi:hypothetical protein